MFTKSTNPLLSSLFNMKFLWHLTLLRSSYPCALCRSKKFILFLYYKLTTLNLWCSYKFGYTLAHDEKTPKQNTEKSAPIFFVELQKWRRRWKKQQSKKFRCKVDKWILNGTNYDFFSSMLQVRKCFVENSCWNHRRACTGFACACYACDIV